MKKNRTVAAVINRVGLSVRKQRRTLGLSQEELAYQAGLDRTFVSRIERGAINPSLAALVKLSVALKTPLVELIGSPASPRGYP